MNELFYIDTMFGQITKPEQLPLGSLIKINSISSSFLKVETALFSKIEKLGYDVLTDLMVLDLKTSESKLLDLETDFSAEVSIFYSDSALLKNLTIDDLYPKEKPIKALNLTHSKFGHHYYDTGLDVGPYLKRLKEIAFDKGGFYEGVLLLDTKNKKLEAHYIGQFLDYNVSIDTGWTYGSNIQNIVSGNKVGKSSISRPYVYGSGANKAAQITAYDNFIKTKLNSSNYLLIGDIV